MTPPSAEESESAIHIARQPVLDLRGELFGYELLYRDAPDDAFCLAAKDLATARVLTNAIGDVGLDTLTGGHPAFLNVTRPLLVGRVDELVPPGASCSSCSRTSRSTAR